jgi:hypothetical protein
VIAPGIKRRSSASRPDAVEERDVLLRLEEARHPLVLRAMLLSNERRAVDLAVIAYLDRTRITLEQKGLRPAACGAQRPEEKCKKEQPSSGAITAGQSEASINDWMS